MSFNHTTKGFAVGGLGSIVVFEKCDEDTSMYKRQREESLPAINSIYICVRTCVCV